MSTRLSVNINKVALIRNARIGNFPDLYKFASDCERFGAQGITVHPRPDERHIRYADIPILKDLVTTELNIEGNPTDSFVEMVCEQRPDQVTLVPDSPEALTSDAGWDTVLHRAFLTAVTRQFQDYGVRVSIFVDPIVRMVEEVAAIGAERIELYTGAYAHQFSENPEQAVSPHVEAALVAQSLGLEVNAGHDLNLHNLRFYQQRVLPLHEVSIGHALTVDALYYGIENAIQLYKRALATYD